MQHLILTFFSNLLFNFILVFEVLILRLQNHSNCHFYFKHAQKMRYEYSNLLCAHSKYSGNNINMAPLFLLVNSRRGNLIGLFPVWCICCCFSDIMETPSVAIRAFKTCWELLNAHSKYGQSCPIYHIGAQSNTTGLHDVNRAAPTIC